MTLFHDPVLFHCAYKSSKVFDITESDSSLMQATHRQRSTSFKASGPKRNPFQDAYNDEMKTVSEAEGFRSTPSPETVMQTRDEVEGLHNCQEFSQPLECLYQAMQTQEKSFLLLL